MGKMIYIYSFFAQRNFDIIAPWISQASKKFIEKYGLVVHSAYAYKFWCKKT